MENLKLYFQDIHYKRRETSFLLKTCLILFDFFYSSIIKLKNFLYEKGFLKEYKCSSYVICIGNLTTGGVGKTPIVQEYAKNLSKENNVAIISRGYKAKISTKKPVLIKDSYNTYFKDGSLCGDEIYQLTQNTPDNVVVIICKNRKLAAQEAIVKHKCNIIIMDDGFSNRQLYKNKTILAIDSKMRFGRERLLPYGPLREPINEIKRADELILVNKNDKNIDEAKAWIKKFNLKYKICSMYPKRIYNCQTKANVTGFNNAIAFCAIGQAMQFFSFAQEFYNLKACVSFSDHYDYKIKDIKNLIKTAKKNNVTTFITTQKDETKILKLLKKIDTTGYSFNVLELETVIE